MDNQTNVQEGLIEVAAPYDCIDFSEQINENGQGSGCHGHVIQKNGLKLTGYVSIDENFLGVNCEGTDESLDDYDISWNIKVYNSEALICEDEREMTILELRSCGSLGTFYNQQQRQSLIDFYRVELQTKVSKKNT